MPAGDGENHGRDEVSGSPAAARALRARIRGRVQGVGFRYFVLRRARELGLRGFVRNLADGTVELVAEGPEPALRSLLDAASQGPPAARVDGVDVTWGSPQGGFDGFTIL